VITSQFPAELRWPLEALAKLARQGRLSPKDSFFARVVSADGDGMPQNIVSVALTGELTTPARRGNK
jgi:hypothetical protein